VTAIVSREPAASKKSVTGGHLVARALKAEGVEAIFTLCGGHIIDIYDGCTDAGIRILDVRHEQAAAHAADAWTRLTGVPGVAVVTAGPGTTDTVTAVANAWRAQTPMLVIGGQGALKQAYMGSLQELDHVGIMKPITKFAATVYHTERIPEMIGMAFRQAFNGRPGPVFLEIPRDVLDAGVEESAVVDAGKYRSAGKTFGDVPLVEQAGRLPGLDLPRRRRAASVHRGRPGAGLSQRGRARLPAGRSSAAVQSLPP
jgi:acetolactate synthase-1/2/3 large subunit